MSYSLDRRLAGLAARFDARYTRYVDDLTFSGGPSLRRGRSRFVKHIDDIVRDEGFRLNDRKTVVLGDSGRQALLGAVVNDHPTVSRPERDALRDRPPEYVLGRISWVAGFDPALGARLRRTYDAVDWS